MEAGPQQLNRPPAAVGAPGSIWPAGEADRHACRFGVRRDWRKISRHADDLVRTANRESAQSPRARADFLRGAVLESATDGTGTDLSWSEVQWHRPAG